MGAFHEIVTPRNEIRSYRLCDCLAPPPLSLSLGCLVRLLSCLLVLPLSLPLCCGAEKIERFPDLLADRACLPACLQNLAARQGKREKESRKAHLILVSPPQLRGCFFWIPQRSPPVPPKPNPPLARDRLVSRSKPALPPSRDRRKSGRAATPEASHPRKRFGEAKETGEGIGRGGE